MALIFFAVKTLIYMTPLYMTYDISLGDCKCALYCITRREINTFFPKIQLEVASTANFTVNLHKQHPSIPKQRIYL